MDKLIEKAIKNCKINKYEKYFEQVCKEYKRLLDAENQQLNLQSVMASVSDNLLVKASEYEDEANADFDTDGVQHNLNIGRYDGLMQAIQEINKHLP